MNPFENIRYHDPAQSGMQAFQQGMQMAQQIGGQNALSQFAANPDDPEAFKGLAKYHPEKAMQIRQQQQAQQQKTQEQQRELIGRAVQMADTPEKWDAVARQLAQRGIPEAAQFVGKFSPELRSIMMAEAGLSSPEDRATSLQKNYEWLQKINPDAAAQYLKSETEGNPLIASNGDGTFTIIPRGVAQGGQPAPQQLGPPAPPNVTFTPVDGGQTPPASGNFQDPLAPR